VPVVFRLITVVVMLLHSFFGCSLHHAYSCDSHSHLAGGQVCTENHRDVNHQTVDARAGCCRGHDGNGHGESTPNQSSMAEVASMAASCPGCESGPCDGSIPGCHSEVGCSFVPASDVVFIRDVVVFEFVAYEHGPSIARVRAAAWQQDLRQHTKNFENSMTRCAALCTWLI